MTCNRRDFLKLGACAFTASFLPLPALAAVLSGNDAKRHLGFYNTHTGESTNVCFYDNGSYCLKSLKQINHVLRDHRTNEIKPIDLKLLDRLYALKVKIGATSPFHVISGYRSAATNAMLRKKKATVWPERAFTPGAKPSISAYRVMIRVNCAMPAYPSSPVVSGTTRIPTSSIWIRGR